MIRLLRAEWTKLRTVPRWMVTLAAAVVLTILVAVSSAAASGSSSAGGGGGGGPSTPPTFEDAGHFVHRILAGDGGLVAHVAAQANSQESAKAGIMIRAGAERNTAYAAVFVTPDHGVRLQSGYGVVDIAGSSGGAPRWLRLDRDGTTVTGYESADGHDWSRVGSVRLDGLTGSAELGLFVASPNAVKVQRQFGGENVDEMPTIGKATFDGLRAEPAADGPWQDTDRSILPEHARFTEAGGTVTLAGSGDVGSLTQYGPDLTRMTLSGVLLGLMAVVALAVLFVTSEYKRGVIHLTFAASPARVRVLAAKALVLGAATFAAGLVASFGAFLAASAIAATNGFEMPSLADGSVLRAVVGTAALLAVVAVFGMAVATILRRGAAAITVVLLLLLVPYILATGLPLSVAAWVTRLTPAAGFAIQDTVRRYDTAIAPWAGFGVLCAYAAVALAVAAWRLNRRDA
jgi:ABC-type transport system involved in multi-copper enzyme maturation permease subunit